MSNLHKSPQDARAPMNCSGTKLENTSLSTGKSNGLLGIHATCTSASTFSYFADIRSNLTIALCQLPKCLKRTFYLLGRHAIGNAEEARTTEAVTGYQHKIIL